MTLYHTAPLKSLDLVLIQVKDVSKPMTVDEE